MWGVFVGGKFMSKKVKKIPKKQLTTIRKFLKKQFEEEYLEKETLTHQYMDAYLKREAISRPRRIPFNRVTEEDLRKGRVIYVRDKKNHIAPYIDPHYVDSSVLMNELNQSIEQLNSIRQRLLKLELKKRKLEKKEYLESLTYQGLIEDSLGNIISIKEYELELLENAYDKKHIKRRK